MRALVFLSLLLTTAGAHAQFEGVHLAYRDPTPIAARKPHGPLFVGEDLVGIAIHQTKGGPCLYSLNGAVVAQLNVPYPVHSAAFAGEHLYLASALEGVVCLAADDRREVFRMKTESPNHIGYLMARGDGQHIVLSRNMFPDAIEFWKRNLESGTLTRTAVFQPDENALADDHMVAERMPDVRIEINPQAVRLEHLNGIADMTFNASHNGTLFVSSQCTLFAFGCESGQFKHICTARDGNRGIITMGLSGVPYSVAARGKHVFAGGNDLLSWFVFDGRSLESHQWWVDEGAGWENRPSFPFLDCVRALAISNNGQFLFVGSAPGNRTPDSEFHKIHVLEIGEADLTHVGSIPAGGEGSYLLQLELSPDGKHLCAQTTDCQLMIFDLDERFWK